MVAKYEARVYSGQLTKEFIDKSVLVCGWVDTLRDHGGLLFIHVRDVSGVCQVLFDPEDKEIFEVAQQLRSEFVVEIEGKVELRSEDTINPNIPTGDLELRAVSLKILSRANTLPFTVSQKDVFDGNEKEAVVNEDLRLKYRYLDLRRKWMQQNLVKRSQMNKVIRNYLEKLDFHEVETPVLTKSTPEGARDYLVPSRVQEHKFYALPQSPQLFKQLLMVSGLDRYFQITKCFRDEDLRPNRQPEFTQLDMEASFIDEAYVIKTIEPLILELFKINDLSLTGPFKQISYEEAMEKYGNDHPDLRFGMEMINVSDLLVNTSYKIFNTILQNGGSIKGINIQGQAAALSKNVLQEEFAKKLIPKLGGKGMTWMKVEEGTLVSNIVQFFSEAEITSLIERMGAKDGDVLIFIADTSPALVNRVLGEFRLYVANYLNLIDSNKYAACWVRDFPLFELKDKRLSSMHHPFTRPQENIDNINSQEDWLKVKACAYDLVINGEEIGGGSLRIYDEDQQDKIFQAIGMKKEEINERFGFFLEAMKYGTPPHGGIALGLDRLYSMLFKTQSIRDVIAFPKNRMATCPLTSAPSTVDSKQLTELHVELKKDLS